MDSALGRQASDMVLSDPCLLVFTPSCLCLMNRIQQKRWDVTFKMRF